jgi:hypothetical protein
MYYDTVTLRLRVDLDNIRVRGVFLRRRNKEILWDYETAYWVTYFISKI